MEREKGPELLAASGDERFLEFSSSLDTDLPMFRHEVAASIAYVRSLARAGILTPDDERTLISGLKGIYEDVTSGHLRFDPMLEDVHMNLESMLVDRVGETAKLLHTGRSRNEQISVDERLYLRERIADMVSGMLEMERTLVGIAERHLHTSMPGYTHMQPAQPMTLGFWACSHAFRIARDIDRFLQAYRRVNVCPLGSGAITGSPVPHDLDHLAELLGFDAPTENALDTVGSRDHLLDTAYALAATSINLSTLCEDAVLFISPAVGFASPGQGAATGSSMMPQKSNPDAFELVRGLTGPCVSALLSLMVCLKSLPSGYNRDLQHDRTILFPELERYADAVRILAASMAALEFDVERMRSAAEEGYMNATDLAYHLTRSGVPFRDAYRMTAELVQDARARGKRLQEMDIRSIVSQAGEDVHGDITVDACISRRSVPCGTSPPSVSGQVKTLRVLIREQEKSLARIRKDISTCESLLHA